MKNILIVFNSPEELGIPQEAFNDPEVMDYCFRIRRYGTAGQALEAYANTMCTYSHLVDEETDIEDFLDEVIRHMQANDYDWLEENFN